MASVSDINLLYAKYYSDNPELAGIVRTHSEQVAKKAINIVQDKKLPLNLNDVYLAAMVHDIGVVKCYAPDIKAFGNLPYLQHGLEGKKILEIHGLTQFANICATHTGSGITKQEIINNNLPLPEEDMLPKTLLEKLICYADKFFSKSKNLLVEKDIDEVMSQMKKHGEGPFNRFLELHSLFGSESDQADLN